MARSTEICNIAISHLGVSKEIADVDTEQSQEASACRRFYDDALKLLFRNFSWGFATKIAALALLEEDPNEEWLFSYAYPTDCARINKIQSGTVFDTRGSRIDYRLANNGSQRIIFTNQEDATAEYVELTEDDNLYPVDFKLAFSYLLAALIAPRVTKGDPFKLKTEMFEKFNKMLSEAKANGLNEEQWPQEPDGEFLRSRNE